ncbi:MAG: efflux RND transporter periplasmic adaptor subunit [Bacteroidetes bacterium]|nr:efflux RND transporter periplasmic adaptor subunit [Bacteroidota bacterium]
MKFGKKIILISLFVALLIGLKILFFPKENHDQKGQGKGNAKHPQSVNYIVASKKNISNTIYSNGTIGAFNELELKPEIQGRVVDIYFKEGQQVQKGQLLVKINDADFQAQLQKIKSQINLSQQKFERSKKLLLNNAISKEEFETQENELNSFNADKAFAEVQIQKCNITAPFNGKIGLKNISIGTFITPTSTITTLVQTSPMFVEFSLPEQYSQIVKEGNSIDFQLSDTTHYKANIYASDFKIDASTKTIKYRAIYNGNKNILSGSFAKVFIDLGTTVNSIYIPTQSIVPIFKGQKVFVIKNNKASSVKIQTGLRTDNLIQVISGLNEGDSIITTGLLSLKDGSDIKIIK